MRKSIFLAAGFAATLLFSGCEKAVVNPLDNVSVNSHAETVPAFYLVSEDGTWGRYYYTRDGEFHRAQLVASFDKDSNPLLAVVAADDSDTSIRFDEATQTESVIRVVTAEGDILHEQLIPVGTTAVDLTKSRVSDDHHRVGSIVQLLTKSSTSSLQFSVVTKLP